MAIARLAMRANRQVGQCLGRDLYSTPAWDMLIDLYVRGNDRSISLTSLGGATAVPERTALFTISRLVERKLLVRSPDPSDGRRINVQLSEEAVALLDHCFDMLIEMLASN